MFSGRDFTPQQRRIARILYVEDHLDALEALTRLLRRDGFEVEPHNRCKSALDAVNAGSRFDVLLCDMGFPDGESGLDLLTQLRSIAPVDGIAITGYGNEVDVAATRQAGYTYHITKPIQYPKIVEAIDAILNSSRGIGMQEVSASASNAAPA